MNTTSDTTVNCPKTAEAFKKLGTCDIEITHFRYVNAFENIAGSSAGYIKLSPAEFFKLPERIRDDALLPLYQIRNAMLQDRIVPYGGKTYVKATNRTTGEVFEGVSICHQNDHFCRARGIEEAIADLWSKAHPSAKE